ncbi:TonB-dependent receptor [Parabacteroides sp. OttesenSCG-928-K15]|nr:TonB-dependent receptor [Parabacteroides sp. OttesenSCG-928-K15]
MKLIVLFAVVSFLQLAAASSHAQEAKISLKFNNATLKHAIQAIEDNTQYVFFLNNSEVDLEKPVSLDVTNGNINDVLKQIFANRPYRIENHKIILLSRGEEAPQQTGRITGRIVDYYGEPVIGANVVEIGTTNGTITNYDGEFTLNINPGSRMRVSYIGYVTKELEITSETNYTIQIVEDSQALEEVVVVGYGVQKKVNVVGSIATVDSKQLEGRSQSSVVSTLTGQMPGVTVTHAGGQPGVHTGTIRVRGVGSFGATPSALVLIDGIPGNLTDINPGDITSISVLKDASSAAIYGARAANGVVLVSTKMGQEGKVTVSYNGYAGFNRATALPEYVDSWEYAALLNKVDGMTRFTDAEIQAMKDGSMPDQYANEKPVDDIFSNNGFQTGHDLSVTGGSDRSHYYASFGFLDQNGIVAKNKLTRYTARLNLTSKLSDKITMTIRLRGDHSKREEPNIAGSMDGDGMLVMIQQGMRFPGFRPSVLSDGSWGPGVKNFGTPKAWLNSESLLEVPTKRFNANVQFEYKPIQGLTLTAIGAYNYQNSISKSFRATLPVSINNVTTVLGPSKLTEDHSNTAYKSFQATANYVKDFKDHNLNLLLGYSWEDQTYRNISAGRDNFPNNNLPYLTAGSPENQTNSGGGNDWVIQSLFGRLQYNYKEKYLAEATVRYDGSSRFPTTERFGVFPSAALGWRLSEENFMKDNASLSFINNLKLKASAGILGNNEIGNYPYQSVYNLGSAYNYSIGQNISQGARLTTYTDPTLKWETTRTVDAGFESTFWDGLLSAGATYFYKYTYDILYKPNASVSSIFGLTLSEVNTGEMVNKGWEFELSHRNMIGKVRYGVNANFSVIHNEVKTLGVGDVEQANGMVGNGSNLFVGYAMQPYYGYKTDGVFLDQADIDSWFAHTDQTSLGASKANTKPGDIRYMDISGPDGVPDGKVDPTYDRVYLGSQIPKYTFGVSLNAEYKGFDLNLFFQGVAGVKGYLSNYAGWAFFSEGNVQRWQMEEAFDENNPTRYPNYPRLTNLGNATQLNNQLSDFWVRNASYLRLKNIQLGYNIPRKLFANSFISSIRVYASAENPYTWHKYPQGWDPETNTSGNYYPFMQTYTFGLNIKF